MFAYEHGRGPRRGAVTARPSARQDAPAHRGRARRRPGGSRRSSVGRVSQNASPRRRSTGSFGDRQVLTTCPSTWPPGRMTGFVGANGAGKTTTMRIILGVLAARLRRGDAGGGAPLTRQDRAPLRLHAGGARALPEDERPRAARLPRPAARPDAGRGAAQRRRSCSNGSGSASAATTRWRRCRWATSSAPRSPPRWCTTPRCWSSTSRSPASTRSPSTPCVAVLRERGRGRRAGALLQPPARRRRAALRRPGDHRRRGDPRPPASRRAAARPVHRARATSSSSDGDAGWVRDEPGVTVVEFDGARARLRPRRPDADDQAVLRAALRTRRRCAPSRPVSPVAGRDLPGGHPMSTDHGQRHPAGRRNARSEVKIARPRPS